MTTSRLGSTFLWLLVVLLTGPSLVQAQGGATPVRPVVDDAVPAAYAAMSSTAWAQLKTGRRHLFNGNMQAAETAFDALSDAGETAAAFGAHGRMTVSLYKGLFTEDRRYFVEVATRAEDLGQALDRLPDGPTRGLLGAERKLIQALASGRRGAYLRAAWQARASFKQFQTLNDDHPDLADAQFGLGLLHLVIGSLPESQQRWLGILGFEGDVERGRDELQRAERDGHLNAVHATLSLSLVDLLLYEQADPALERLGALHDASPSSSLYGYLYGFALLTNRQAKEAEAVLQSAVDTAATSETFFVDYVDYFLGRTHLLQQRYGVAERHFRRYLGRHRGQALQAQAYLSLGLAVELQGRREEAMAYYRLVSDDRGFSSDVAAYRRAQDRLASPVTATDRLLLEARFAYDAGQSDLAVERLRAAFRRSDVSSDQRAEARYRLARVFHSEGDLDRALVYYADVQAAPGAEASKWGAYSWLYTGDIHAAQGRPGTARTAYRKALNWPRPYDFDESLEQTVTAKLTLMGE